IPPTETPIRIRRLPNGDIETGPNVVEVTPTAPVAGFVGGDLRDLTRISGTTSSQILYEVVDPRALPDDHVYRITFEDTLRLGTRTTPDTLTTKNFSLIDVTIGDTLLNRSTAFRPEIEFPVFDDLGDPLGFKLFFRPEPFIVVNRTDTGWDSEEVYPISLEPYIAAGFIKGLRNPADYRVKVVGPGEGQSIELEVRRRFTLPSRPTNIQVFQVDPEGNETPVDYAFWDLSGDDFISATSTEPASFSASPVDGESDLIILFEPQVGSTTSDPVVTWKIGLNFTVADRRDPVQGEVANIVTKKPFLSSDSFEFTTAQPSVDASNPDSLLDMIRVVPNPYVVTNRFESLNPFSTGRGPRVIKFTHLPPEATVRIFTVSGKLIRVLQRDEGSNEAMSATALMNGTINWDLQTNDDLTVAYGVYLYHVEAPGIGEKTGTFAIIK
ncbi:MAG: hypothetical protein KJO98_01425, partial [Rhodothermia bacterium]|nr:hypothetical protein [Rhodothermia bacterium]